ncbi:MAG TPA: apolipoprotein N-acyltransferase [Gemmatimonadales bacterium]|nr:apolipoprotein N-acyltransferase [Gemmatimonadales bacterium]
MSLSSRRGWTLVALGAVALAGCYPPFPLPFLSFVALIPPALLLFDTEGNSRAAWRWGFRYGLIANALVLYWMVVALWHFTPFAALGYAITVYLLGVFMGGLFWFVTRVRSVYPRLPLLLVFPLAWTALEWAVGHLGDVAFPWLGLGTSLADGRVLVQWADIAGARGVTLWLVWCNVLLAMAISGQGLAGAPRYIRRLLPVAFTVLAAWGYGTWRERSLPLRPVGTIALVQPNIGFDEKWDPAVADSEVGLLLGLSQTATTGVRPGLVVWPEAAVPGYFVEHPDWQARIGAFAAERRIPVLTGVVHVQFRDRGYTAYNAAVMFDSLGQWRSHGVYEKHYLVPVVERVPFVPVAWFRALPGLSRWSGGFGRGDSLPLFPTSLGRAGVMVCYESAFEDLARRYRGAGADFLVNITNDAWFGRTAAPYQHESHLVLRAIETRMGIARGANDGVSEFIDPLGRATSQSALETRTVVTGQLLTSDVRTLYVQWGDWVGRLAVIGVLVMIGGLIVHRVGHRT